MSTEPETKRVYAFFDGQNLFKAAKEAFGSGWPDYDPTLLSLKICEQFSGWNLHAVHFYTGIPEKTRDKFWNDFWARKLAQMGKQGVKVYSRPLRYRRTEIALGHGGSLETDIAVEKGIDVRIAIDIIRMCLHDKYDVAIIFSQDQDLSEVADEIRLIADERGRWIKVASAFPLGGKNDRGINKTDWIKIDHDLYDRCRDRRDYRPRTQS